MATKKKKPTSRFKKFLAVGLATAALSGALVAGHFIYKGEKVIEVIDGDTFRIENKQLVRLYSIDAPETGRCMSAEAKAKLSSLVLGKRVVINDIRSGGYNRVMGDIYVNGVSVDAEMAKAGMGNLFRGYMGRVDLKAAGDYARSNHLGIYSPSCYQLVNTRQPSCVIKGNISSMTRIKRYFLPTCESYNLTIVWLSYGDQWFCSENEAQKAGFIKGTKCE